MMLTDLADVARAAGLRVIEVAGWRTRGHGQMVDVKTIICHHTGGAPTGNYPSLRVVRDGRADLAGPLAHLGLARDGTVYVIAAGLCWHAGQSRDRSYENQHAIGIEAENSGSQPWPGVQMTAYVTLCRALADHYRVPYDRVLGHKETCAPVGRKADPAFDMIAFRARLTVRATPASDDTDDLEDSMAPVIFTDAYQYDQAIKAGKTDVQAREIAKVTYSDSTKALAGLGSFMSSILRDVKAIRADVDELKKGTRA